MLNIGHRPTINNGNNLSIEVNILNFSENIYHKEMRIEFVKYLRPEEKYDTIDALIAQMHKDREKRPEFFSKYKGALYSLPLFKLLFLHIFVYSQFCLLENSSFYVIRADKITPASERKCYRKN